MALDQPIILTESQKKELKEYLSFEFTQAQSIRTQRDQDWKELERIYEGRPRQKVKTDPWQNASNIEIPLVGIAADSVAARTSEILYERDPFFKVEGLNAQAEGVESDLQIFLDALDVFELNLEVEGTKGLQSATKTGDGYLVVTWEQDQGGDVIDEEGRQNADLAIPVFRGVKVRWHDPNDVWYPGDALEIQTAPWVSLVRHYRWGTMVKLQKAGIFADIEKKLGVASQSGEKVSTSVRQEGNITQTKSEEISTQAHMKAVINVKRFAIHEIWAKYDLDGQGERKIRIFYERETESILNVFPWPYRHGRRPIVKMPMFPRPGHWESMGITEYGKQFQSAVSTMVNQGIDNHTIVNMRAIKVKRGLNVKKIQIRPGALLVSDDPVNDFLPLQLGDIYPSTFQLMNFLIGLSRLRIGNTEQTQGTASRRETATTTTTLLAQANKRLNWTIRMLRGEMAEIAFQALELYQQFSPKGKAFQMTGKSGERVEQLLAIPALSLRGQFRITVSSISETGSTEADRALTLQVFQIFDGYWQKMLEVIGLLGRKDIPLAQQQYATQILEKSVFFMEEIFRDFKIRDVKKFLPDAIVALEAAQQATQQAEETVDEEATEEDLQRAGQDRQLADQEAAQQGV